MSAKKTNAHPRDDPRVAQSPLRCCGSMKRIWNLLLEYPATLSRLAQNDRNGADPEMVQQILRLWQADGQPDPEQWLAHNKTRVVGLNIR